jgi:hypothetical protein
MKGQTALPVPATTNEVSCQFGEALGVSVCPPVLYLDVLAINPTELS